MHLHLQSDLPTHANALLSSFGPSYRLLTLKLYYKHTFNSIPPLTQKHSSSTSSKQQQQRRPSARAGIKKPVDGVSSFVRFFFCRSCSILSMFHNNPKAHSLVLNVQQFESLFAERPTSGEANEAKNIKINK